MAADNNNTDKPHRRRKRYTGSHPKNFNEKYKELNPQKYPQIHGHLRAKGKTPAGTHVPIMVEEIIALLKPAPGQIVADCTVGYGGHAAEFLKQLGPEGKLIALDVDAEEMEKTKQRLSNFPTPTSFYNTNFAGLPKVLEEEKLDGFDIIFADIGVSSMQVDDAARGISYKNKGPLDMRMDKRLQLTGADLLLRLSQEELSQGFFELSDEPDHEKIASWIVQQRQTSPITQTSQLVRLIFKAKGLEINRWQQEQAKQKKFGQLHPAARTFQALRIMVNDELGVLKQLLRIAPTCLRPGGRIGIISFHSGEDRLVKQAFKQGKESGIYDTIAQNPIRPRTKEIVSNPRSSSAKFRWAKKPAKKCS